MLRRILRVLFGFFLACLASAMVLVTFADIQILRTVGTENADVLLASYGARSLFAAIKGAMFAGPIALFGIFIGEWRHIQTWTYYTLLALAITFLGFLAWSTAEHAGDPTIVNNYALTAFITTGFVGGLIYWLFSGRNAGKPYRKQHGVANTPTVQTATKAAREAPAQVKTKAKNTDPTVSLAKQITKDEPQKGTKAPAKDASATAKTTTKPAATAKQTATTLTTQTIEKSATVQTTSGKTLTEEKTATIAASARDTLVAAKTLTKPDVSAAQLASAASEKMATSATEAAKKLAETIEKRSTTTTSVPKTSSETK